MDRKTCSHLPKTGLFIIIIIIFVQIIHARHRLGHRRSSTRIWAWTALVNVSALTICHRCLSFFSFSFFFSSLFFFQIKHPNRHACVCTSQQPEYLKMKCSIANVWVWPIVDFTFKCFIDAFSEWVEYKYARVHIFSLVWYQPIQTCWLLACVLKNVNECLLNA